MRNLFKLLIIFSLVFLFSCSSSKSAAESDANKGSDSDGRESGTIDEEDEDYVLYPATNEAFVCRNFDLCYDNEGEIVCPEYGEKFYGQDAQYSKRGFCTKRHFSVKSDVKDEKVTVDNYTGLEWTSSFFLERTWKEASDFCKNLEYGGFSYWRLPTLPETVTIAGLNDEEAAESGFEYRQNSSDDLYFWTSSMDYSDYSGNYYPYIIKDHNDSGEQSVYDVETTIAQKEESHILRCVRGEKYDTYSLLITKSMAGDEVLEGSRYKLLWQKNLETEKNWEEALSYCENLEYAGFSDWRLPSINELFTMYNYEIRRFAVEITDYPHLFWSSSTKIGSPEEAYTFSALGGYTETREKNIEYGTFCVRGGGLCEGGFFWNGEGCVEDPCKDIENALDECFPKSAKRYRCACAEGFFWDGKKCASPCKADSCKDGEKCVAKDLKTYTCKCKDGYRINGKKCEEIDISKNICTGQKLCYNEENYKSPSKWAKEFEMPCAEEGGELFGQDSQYAGKTCKPLNFTSSYGIITEHASGLNWLSADKQLKYDDAKAYCENVGEGWRLPEIWELVNLVDTNDYSGPEFWSELGISAYRLMSGTLYGKNVLVVWIGMTEVRATGYEMDFICVKGDKKEHSSKFEISKNNGEKIVKDPATDLIWQKSNAPSELNWADALAYCENLEYAGYSDWRLPNRNELFSLVNYEKSDMATYFPDMDAMDSFLWSSTTNIAKTDDVLRKVRDYEEDDDDYYDYSYYDNEAWCVDLKSGKIEREDKWELHSVKCVR
jgi:hypothetical protein